MKPLYLIIAVFAVLFTGCASHVDRASNARSAYYTGDIVKARSLIEEQISHSPKGETDVLLLDRAIVDLTTGNSQSAESTLREVRDHFDLFEQKTAAEGIKSMLTDDNAISYAGDDYEKVLIRVFLALSNLMNDNTDAAAYALQATMKQDEIVQNAAKIKTSKDDKDGVNPKLAYKRVPIGLYIHGLLREETKLNYDDAKRDYRTVVEWFPEFEQGKADLKRAESGVHSQPGNGVVYVFGLVGRGPYKERTEAEVTEAALFVSSIILNAFTSRTVTPSIAPIFVPTAIQPRNNIDKLCVTVANTNDVHFTEKITDIGKMAVEQNAANELQTIARAVARRAVKTGVIYGAKTVADANKYTSLAMDVVGIIWESSEAPDTRCWSFLPESIQVARIELPAGEHNVFLEPIDYHSNKMSSNPKANSVNVRVEAGRNTYVIANFPTAKPLGIVTSK
ncbi:MAG: hypothetical protein LBU65_17015 [Planctomycetaceae bacterium]|jgi:hypothetical protein|nr:hypothetical protein [Planctomycetaceae bacterium]